MEQLIKSNKICSSTNIFVATQSTLPFDLSSCFVDIFVGAEKYKDQDQIKFFSTRDDTGDNISQFNYTYCELTALYWLWKNNKAKIVGLNHYRRYFLMDVQLHFKVDRLPFTVEDTKLVQSIRDLNSLEQKKVEAGTWIVAPMRSIGRSVYADYVKDPVCLEEDLHKLIEIFERRHPADHELLVSFLNDNKIIHFNMFITNRKNVNEYCTWLFDILEEMRVNLNWEGRTSQQKRVLGFIAERLFTFYLLNKSKNIEDRVVGYLNAKHRIFKIPLSKNIQLRSLYYRMAWIARYLKEMLDR